MSRDDVTDDLLHELSLHHGVEATVATSDGVTQITISTPDSAPAIWEVRATIGLFDEEAQEVS